MSETERESDSSSGSPQASRKATASKKHIGFQAQTYPSSKNLFTASLKLAGSQAEKDFLERFPSAATATQPKRPTPVPTSPAPLPTFNANEVKQRRLQALRHREAQLQQAEHDKQQAAEKKAKDKEDLVEARKAQLVNQCPGIESKYVDAIIETAFNPPKQPDKAAIAELAKLVRFDTIDPTKLQAAGDNDKLYSLLTDPSQQAAFVVYLSKFVRGQRFHPSSSELSQINTLTFQATLSLRMILPESRGVACGMCLQNRDASNYDQFRFWQSAKYDYGKSNSRPALPGQSLLKPGPGQGHVYFKHLNCPAMLKHPWDVYTYITDSSASGLAKPAAGSLTATAQDLPAPANQASEAKSPPADESNSKVRRRPVRECSKGDKDLSPKDKTAQPTSAQTTV